MNYKRFAILADHFDDLAAAEDKKKIDMAKWIRLNEIPKDEVKKIVEGRSHYVEDKPFKHKVLKEGFCNSVACVIGHATSNSKLRKQGLRMSIKIEAPDAEGVCEVVDFDPVMVVGGKIVASNFDAIQQFFDVSYNHAQVLFGGDPDAKRFYSGRGDRNPTLRQVAKKLRAYANDPQILDDYIGRF